MKVSLFRSKNKMFTAIVSLAMFMLLGGMVQANGWKGVPYVQETQQAQWGRYYDDGNLTKGGGTRGETTVTYQTSTSSYYIRTSTVPYYGNSKNGCVEILYSAANLDNTAGRITKLAFYCGTQGSWSGNTIKIYLAHLSKSAHPNAYFSNATDSIHYSTMTLVYSGAVTLGASEGWQTFSFNENTFDYNGTDHLAVIVSRTGTSNTNPKWSGYYVSSGSNYFSLYRGTANPASIAAFSTNQTRPWLKLTMQTGYSVEAADVSHGTIELSKTPADPSSWVSSIDELEGDGTETIYVKLTADDGYHLKDGSLSATGVATLTEETPGSLYSFTMPDADVVVKARFINGSEPTVVEIDDRENSALKLYDNSTLINRTPCDVNITYYGYGKYNNSILPGALTSSTTLTDLPDGVEVAVGHAEDESEHTFIYHKTLEKTSGNWSYTTINNPFYHRPVIAGDYYGFAAWRLKSGNIVSGYAVGDIIPADTKLSITGAGNIELEAVWVKANVVTSATQANLSTDYTAETQFYVYGSGGTVGALKNYPLTYTSVYPDGSNYGDGSGILSITLSANVSLAYDTRFEYLNFGTTASYYLNAAGHNLIYGRGVGGTSANTVYGWYTESASTTNVAFADHFESGLFTRIDLTKASSRYKVTGKAEVIATFGSDYDRAKGINTNLTVNDEVFVGNYLGFSDEENTVLDLQVKSGTFGVNHVSDGTQASERIFYLGFFNRPDSQTTGGIRNTEILGGHFIGTISGGTDLYYNYSGDIHSSVGIRIKGGVFDSFIYGGAQYVAAYGQRDIIITGGTFGSWIAGGCNGTSVGGGATYGNTNIYFGGDANQTVDSCIFGAGFGRTEVYGGANEDSYYVESSTIVVADAAHIAGSVYGGGNNGYAQNGSTIQVLGGTIDGNVFGGSNKSKGGGSNVTMSGGSISGSLYGGSNSKGKISAATNVTINGGTIGGNVFGAGCGASTIVSANTVVNVNVNANVTGNVYGGGEYGSCGGTEVNINSGTVGGSVFGGGEHGTSGATVVNINGGTVSGNAYAGALGNSGDVLVFGDKTLNMKGGTVNGSVYGGSRNANDGYSTDDLIIGTGSLASTYMPFNNRVYNSYSEFIYTADELSDIGSVISSLSFYCTTPTQKQAIASLKIYIGYRSTMHSDETDWTNPTDLTLVYSRTYSSFSGHIGGVDGWEEYVFDTPFLYDHTDNLVVVVAKNGSTNNNNLYYHVTTESSLPAGLVLYAQGIYAYNADHAGSLSTSNNRPNIKFGSSGESPSSFVNLASGTIAKNVYGGGFYGSVTGNTYVNIGKNAIENSPCATANSNKPSSISVGTLNIGQSVYAGSDWGEFTAGGSFMPSNITGVSNIYVDGTGYTDGSLVIGNSIYGSGTSGDAGTDREIVIRNYGIKSGSPFNACSRKLHTIQRADRLVLDNAHIELTGKGSIASATTTETFAILNIDESLKIANGSSLVISSPIDSVKAVGSYTCTDVFAAAPEYTPVTIADLSTADKDNKIYFKDGCYLNVYYNNGTANRYGALSGYFHMTADNNTVGFAYARPKVVSGSIAATDGWTEQNTDDGGFVSYVTEENEYDINGNTTGDLVQVQYVHHPVTRDDSEYYRTWKIGTGVSRVSKVITAEADGSNNDILTATVNAQLPYANGCYYQITDVDWGDDAAMVNAGLYEADKYARCYQSGGDYVMGYNQSASACATETAAIQDNPNYTFGLTVLPVKGFQSGYGQTPEIPAVLISADADDLWGNLNVLNNTADKPEVQFMLTYANNIDASASLSPVVITLTEYDCSGNKLQDVEISLTIQTITQIQDVETTVYAMMYGTGAAEVHHDSSTVKVVLPKFVMASGATYSQFSITGVSVSPSVSGATFHPENWFGTNVGNTLDYGMTYKPALTTDEINGWYGAHDINRCFDASAGAVTDFATADGREFTAIDFTVHYNGNVKHDAAEDELATVVFTVNIANFETGVTDKNKSFNITVHIRRRGQAQNWYISSAGSNANSGQYPDKPKRSIKALINAKPAYAVGDKIFIVGEININTPTVWEQPGDNSMGVAMLIYRYPGGHKLSDGTTDATTEPATGQIGQYTGTLVNVNDDLTLDWVAINGQHFADVNWTTYDNDNPNVNPGHNNVVAAAPVFNIAEGGSLNLRNVVQISNNYVTSSSKTANAGGIYMGGEMNVEGFSIDVHENYLNGNKNNVYLPNADSKIGIGDFVYGDIGVTKTAMPAGASHTPIAYSIDEDDFVASDAYAAHSFVPDANGVFTYYNSETTDDTNPYTIYFAMTWVAAVTEKPETFNDEVTPIQITCEEDLAWLISYVNGYNGVSPANPSASAIVTKDLDMNRCIWVPIGNGTSEVAYRGTFDGDLHVIKNLHCSETDGITDQFQYLGMFAHTAGATIRNTYVLDVDFANSVNGGYMAGLVAHVHSGTVEFCETSGKLKALNNMAMMGGVIGYSAGSTMKALTSCTDIDYGTNNVSYLGGVVGSGGTLQTAFANNTFTGTGTVSLNAIGNLAVNDAYALSTTPTTLGSSVTAHGYAPTAYTGTDATGKFTASNYGYGADNNTVSNVPLVNLLNAGKVSGYRWIRAAGSDINGGYPIIVKDVANDSLVVVSEGGKTIRFGYLNQMIDKYKDVDDAQMYMYNTDTITQSIASTDPLRLYIDENVAVMQTAAKVNAYVGITLDNSDGTGSNNQHRDWHMFSSTIEEGKIGIEYNQTGPFTHPTSDNDLTFGTDYSLVQNDAAVYFPNGITQANGNNGSEFDIYNFYEPQYHWINLKRASGNHWHQDNNDSIAYGVNETVFTPGKGYLVAIGGNTATTDTVLMQAYGTLNNGDVEATVTNQGTHLTGYNLLGNPYQSYLDFDAFANYEDGDESNAKALWANTSSIGYKAYLIYDADLQKFDEYLVDNQGKSFSQGAATTAKRYINMHQGFFVVKNGTANDTATNAAKVHFTNDMRVTDATGITFRDEVLSYPLVNLFCTDSDGKQEVSVIELNRPLMAGSLKMKEMLNAKCNMYIRWDDEDFGSIFIDHTPDYVPVWFKAAEEGVFTITWNTANANFGYLHLIDNLTGTDYDCLVNDSYTFQGKPSDSKARFRLVFKPLGIDEETSGEQGENFAFISGDELVVTGEGELSLIDLNGRVLTTEYVSGQQSHIAMPKVAVGMYMLRLANAEGVRVQKIVIRK